MPDKRILLTGARGFIGRHCVPELLARGYEIHAVSSQAAENAAPRKVHWHHTDLLDAAEIRALVAAVRPTHALHLAWVTTPGVYWTSPDNLRWAAAGADLARALADAGARRLVVAGSCAEYDWSRGHCDEADTSLAAATVYGASKHTLRLAIDAIARDSSLRLGWARLFYVYGPGEHPVRLVPSVIRALFRNETAQCTAGTQIRDFLYVKDVAGALGALLDGDVAEPVNIASGRPVAVRELVMMLARQVSRPELVNFSALAEEPPVLTASTTRLSSQMGWRPTYDLATGLSETIQWWKERG